MRRGSGTTTPEASPAASLVGVSRSELLVSQIQECLEAARVAIERDDPAAVYEQVRNIGWVLHAHAEPPKASAGSASGARVETGQPSGGSA